MAGQFIKIIGGMVLFSLLASCGSEEQKTTKIEQKRPNILLIVADDLGYSDLGSFGGEISTPNLDKLAMGGVRLKNFYAAPTCSPTRSMILGGVDHHRTGMGVMAGDQASNQKGLRGYEGYMNYDVVSVAHLLKDAGYHTYMTGKWHLGMSEKHNAKARGFERSFVLLQGGAGHFDDATLLKFFEKSNFTEDGKAVMLPKEFFSSDFYTDKMIDYMKSGEKDGKPFFAYLAFTAPHWPLHAPESFVKKYEGRYDEGYNILKERRIKAMERLGIIAKNIDIRKTSFPEDAIWNELSAKDQKIKAREMEIYAAMVDNMDYNVGRLMDYLEASGQRDNTLIIFMSDNGAEGHVIGEVGAFPQSWIEANFDNSYDNMGKIGSYIYYGPHWAAAAIAPSRMHKGFTSEGGIKVPAFMNFKGRLGALTGQINGEFMTVLDLAPTFLEIAGVKHPGKTYKGREVYEYEGRSLMGFLEGKTDTIHGTDFTFGWELGGRPAIRKGHWKMNLLPPPYGSAKWQLFNLKNDPGEAHDLMQENPEKAKELLSAWQDYMKKNKITMPSELRTY